MAKVKSLWSVSGNLGEANFYVKNGVQYVRKQNSIDPDRIKKAPSYARTRENMMEFAGTSKAIQSLRLGFAEVIATFADNTFSNRLNPIFRQMLKVATGLRGKRPIEIINQRAKLIKLNFNKNDLYSQVCRVGFVMTANAARDGASLAIPPFDPKTAVTPPPGATHFCLVLAVAALSDHTYDPAEGRYVPADPELNGIGKVSRTAVLPLGQPVSTPLNLTATADLPNSMTTTTGMIIGVGIEFYQAVGADNYLFASNNAMYIHDIL